MKLIALELADSGIVSVTGDGSVGRSSPGIAVLDGAEVLVGSEAAAQERLRPRRVHDRFWQMLDTTELGRPHPRGLTTADLAHGHLANIWQRTNGPNDRVLLVIPGVYDRRALGLILGIARSIGIPVRGMVDAAVAGVVNLEPAAGSVVHIDLLLHRAVVSQVSVDQEITRRSVMIEDRVGYRSLQEAWARSVADRFVRTTRFDPLKLAESEQSLYDRLHDLVRRLRTDPEADLSMTAGGREYTVSVSANDVVSVSEASCHRVAALVTQASGEIPTTIVLTDRAAVIPGLTSVLERMGFRDVVELAPGAAAAGALSLGEQLVEDGEEVSFVTSLNRNTGRRSAQSTGESRAESVKRRSGDTPSHVVYRGRALAVGSDPLVFGVATGGGPRTIDIAENTAGISRSHCTIVADGGSVYLHDHSSYGTYLNGDRIEGRAQLVAGDLVRLGTPGETLEAIVVED